MKKLVTFLCLGMLSAISSFSEVSIEYTTPGAGVYRWDAGSGVPDDSQWADSGGLRIGNNNLGSFEPVYRFRVPKISGVTISDITLNLECRERNTFGVGTAVHLERSDGSIRVSQIPLGTHSEWSTGVIGPKTHPGDTLSDYIEVKFVNDGADDLDIGSLKLTVVYQYDDPALLSTYSAICNAYYHLKTYREEYTPVLESMDNGDMIAGALEQGIQKTLAASQATAKVDGFSVSSLDIGNVASWFLVYDDVLGSVTNFAGAVKAWRDVGDSLQNLFDQYGFYTIYDNQGGSTRLRSQLPVTEQDFYELSVTLRDAISDSTIYGADEINNLNVKISDAISALSELMSDAGAYARNVNGANYYNLPVGEKRFDEEIIQGYMDLIKPLGEYTWTGSFPSGSTRWIQPTFLHSMQNFLNEFQASLPPADLNYSINADEVTITGYTGPGGVVEIPATIWGYPVTVIGEAAFRYKSNVTSISLPDSITYIESGSRWSNDVPPFDGCSSLTSVHVHADNANYSSIDGILYNKDQTLLIDVPDGKVGEVDVPYGVISIGQEAFSDCTILTNITVPNSLINVGSLAFENCSSLASFTTPNSVTNIGLGAFLYCTSLERIAIPNSVTSIGQEAFYYCTSLASITLPDDIISIEYRTFEGCDSLTNIVIPSGVISIGFAAFSYCDNLASITLPDTIISIEEDAFYNCPSLISIMLPANVLTVGGDTFDGCSSLTSVHVHADNANYSSIDGILYNKDQTLLIDVPDGKAGSIVVPSSVLSIAGGAFRYCGNISSVLLPSSMSIIEPNMFLYCTSLVNITIPDGVTSIGFQAFVGCSSLTRISIPSSVISIGYYAFYDCGDLTNIYFGGNAPNHDNSFFSLATIYYLPGTTGWTSTYAGRPTVLWNPLIRTDDSSFGIQANQFGFNISGADNEHVKIEACSNLTDDGTWESIITTNLTSGSAYFSDPDYTNHAARYYRLDMP